MSRIKWDGDAADAVRAQEALTAAMDEYKDSAQEAITKLTPLERKARQIAEQANPQEKYNRRMRELAEVATKGKVSIEAATHATMQYQRQLDRAGQSGSRAFDASGLATYIGGLASVGAIVSTITQAFQRAEEAAQAAADSMLDALGAVGELQQLGPEGLQRGLQIQRQLIETGTVRPNQRAQAADIAANMINANLTEDEVTLLIRDLGGAGGRVRGENLTRVGGDMRSLMSQFRQTDMREVAGTVLEAANMTKADLAATANNVLKFGELAAGAGIDFEQALAGYTASEETAASPEAAAEMQKSFYSQVYRRQLAVDGDLFATLENIRSKIPKGGTAFDVLGDANAVIGYEALMKNLDQLRTDWRKIEDAPAVTGPTDDLARTSPAYAAAQAQAREEGQAAVAEEQLAPAEALFEAVMAARRRQAISRGERGVVAAVNEWSNRTFQDTFGFEDSILRGELRAYRAGDSALSRETAEEIARYLGESLGIQREQNTRSRSRGAIRPE